MNRPRRCNCVLCSTNPDHPERDRHPQFKAVIERLGERERRWVTALEAMRLGYGGTRLVAQITGLDEKTIRRGRREVLRGLAECPPSRVRRRGAGRPPVEKKLLASRLP